jgi:hypothetical protein
MHLNSKLVFKASPSIGVIIKVPFLGGKFKLTLNVVTEGIILAVRKTDNLISMTLISLLKFEKKFQILNLSYL